MASEKTEAELAATKEAKRLRKKKIVSRRRYKKTVKARQCKNTVPVEQSPSRKKAVNQRRKNTRDYLGKTFTEVPAKKGDPQVPAKKVHAKYEKAEREVIGTRPVWTTVTGKKGVQKRVQIEVPVYSSSKDSTVSIDRTVNGRVCDARYRVGTPGCQAKAAPKGPRKNPKAKFTWQERNEMRSEALVASKKPVQPRTEFTRNDPVEMTAIRQLRIHAMRSAGAILAHQALLDQKHAHRLFVNDMLSRKVPVEYPDKVSFVFKAIEVQTREPTELQVKRRIKKAEDKRARKKAIALEQAKKAAMKDSLPKAA